MKEVGTNYMIKAWSLEGGNAKNPKKRTTVYSEAIERQFSNGHLISQNLLKSLELEDQFCGEAMNDNDASVDSQNHSNHESNTLVPKGTTSAAATQVLQRESSAAGLVILRWPIKSLKRSASSQGFRSLSQPHPSRSPLGVVNPSQRKMVEPNSDRALESRGAKSRKPKSAGSRTTQQPSTHNAASINRAPIAPMLAQPATTSTQDICPSIEDNLYDASPPPRRRPANKNDAELFR